MARPPFDLETFREQIGGDEEAERLLLRLFLEACEASLVVLRAHASIMPDAMPDPVWKAQMHLIHGAAATLGASVLLQLTAHAEALAASATRAAKNEVLAEIETTCAELCDYIQSLHSE